MGIRITNEKNFGLYCSVDGWAFGPTFRSHEDADSFVDFVHESTNVDIRIIYCDDRERLDALHSAWLAARHAVIRNA